MNELQSAGAARTRLEIDRELDLIHGAAMMVRSGAATRVTIGNLPLAAAVLAAASAAAAPLGARVRALPEGDESPVAVAVERAQ